MPRSRFLLLACCTQEDAKAEMAVRQLTLFYPVADTDQVLGCTIAHELGHLLMGPGHRPNGIMQAAWTDRELANLNQRHFKFNAWERATIAHSLAMRKAAPIRHDDVPPARR